MNNSSNKVFNASTYQVFAVVEGKTVGFARWSIECRNLYMMLTKEMIA